MHSYSSVFKRNAQNEVEQIINISIDITERRLAEEKIEAAKHELHKLNSELESKVKVRTKELEQEKSALKKETERNALVSMATNDVVRDWDLISHELVWNDNYQKFFGYKKSDIHSDVSSWYNRIHSDDKDRVLNVMNEVIDNGRNQWSSEYRFRKADGNYAEIFDRSQILRNAEGIPYRMVSCMTDITTTKRAIKRAEYTESKFRKIFESDMIGMFIANPDGIIVEANNAFQKMIGYTNADFKKGYLKWDDLTPKYHLHKNKAALEQLLKTNLCSPYEKEFVKKDGSNIPVLVGCALLKGENAQTVAYVVDLSEKKKTEKKKNELLKIIQTQQKEFENILMNAPSLISVRRGPELRYTFVNNALKKLTGTKEYLGKTIQEVHPELKDEKGLAAEIELLKTGVPTFGKAYPIKIGKKDGKEQFGWFDFVDIPVYDAIGNIDGIASYGFDVTDLINASNEIKKSEDRFRLITNVMPHMVWTADPEGKVNYYNQVWYDYTGLSQNDKKNIISKIIHPDDIEETTRNWQSVIVNPRPFSAEHRIRRFDGEYRWHMSSTVPQYDSEGNMVMWAGTITDIHDQKLISDAIKVSEDHFRTVAEHTPFMIWQIDDHSMCTYVNKSWLDFTGFSFEESLNMGWTNALHPQDRERESQKFMKAFSKLQPYNSKFRLRNAVGEYRWVFTQSNPLISETFDGYIGSITDITEQELAQQATKDLMQKKDEFMSIASHELKTPITSMKASLQIAQRIVEKEYDSRMSPLIQTANKQVNKLTGLVNDLLDVTKIHAGKMQFNLSEFNITELVKECVNEIQHSTTTHTILFNFDSKVIVEADRNRLEQVITNFLSNAIKYSPGAAKVSVKAQADKENFRIEITDYGIGIPQDKAKYVFDRFFRVQESSQKFAGLGLGLYISSEIIKRHQGKIGVDSKEGKGSTFWFSIPLASETIDKYKQDVSEADKATGELLAQLNISKPRE